MKQNLCNGNSRKIETLDNENSIIIGEHFLKNFVFEIIFRQGNILIKEIKMETIFNKKMLKRKLFVY